MIVINDLADCKIDYNHYITYKMLLTSYLNFQLDSSTTSLPHESAIFRASTAPARLEKDDLCFDPPSPEIDENKSVSFFLGNKETTDTELEVIVKYFF